MRELAALGVRFYPPQMLIRRADKIGLTPDQVTKIRQEILADQTKSVDLVAKLQHDKIEVARLLSADKVDDKAVGTQIDDAAKVEAEMHKLHLGTMLRVRALLTPEQRQKLDAPKAPKPHVDGPGRTAAMDDADDDDDDDDDDDGDEG
jgi:Spy/CpxP family protein refolding chaperone